MAADDNSKQPKKFWVIIGFVGSIASIVSLIWVILEKAPWYVGAISLAVLILSIPVGGIREEGK